MTIYKILLGNNKSKELYKNLLHSIETNIKHLPYTNKYRQTCMYDKINMSVNLLYMLNMLHSLKSDRKLMQALWVGKKLLDINNLHLL